MKCLCMCALQTVHSLSARIHFCSFYIESRTKKATFFIHFYPKTMAVTLNVESEKKQNPKENNFHCHLYQNTVFFISLREKFEKGVMHPHFSSLETTFLPKTFMSLM